MSNVRFKNIILIVVGVVIVVKIKMADCQIETSN